MNGREIVWNESFKGLGHFHGLKGGGNYDGFVIAVPEPICTCH